MNFSLNSLELEIQSQLNLVVETLSDRDYSDDVWTKKVKENLAKLGEAQGFEVATCGFDGEYEKEWLYDIVWYENDQNDMLVNVPLVVESEWQSSTRSIKYDFEKLLVANAGTKLMICQVFNTTRVETLMSYFQKAVDAYKLGRTGERYMIAIMNTGETGDFIYNLFIKR